MKDTCITLRSNQLTVRLSPLGARIMSIEAPDRSGHRDDIVLSYADVRDALNCDRMLGACVGRVANRIAGGWFTLNGQEFRLARNNGPNHLHGGRRGFDKKIFRILPTDPDLSETDDSSEPACSSGPHRKGAAVTFVTTSPDGEEGYPGTVTLQVTYRLEGSCLRILITGRSDRDTLLNPTVHTYFNLTGHPLLADGTGTDIGGHMLQIRADAWYPVDQNGLTTGALLQTENSPLNFRMPTHLQSALNDDYCSHCGTRGIDHSFRLTEAPADTPAVILSDPVSGRRLRIFTDRPAVHVYTGNYLAGGPRSRQGLPYSNRAGIAFEPQFPPNEIHYAAHPATILRAGETFRTETVYAFDTE